MKLKLGRYYMTFTLWEDITDNIDFLSGIIGVVIDMGKDMDPILNSITLMINRKINSL